ncbi:MAG: hypothetical protein Q9195_002830 [Heterodermia aff. obscurata]
MDPISLTASILTVVDETYVVARFIYRTIKSSKNADAELDNIMSSMRVELLFLRSFLVYFERARGSITQVQDLDELTSTAVRAGQRPDDFNLEADPQWNKPSQAMNLKDAVKWGLWGKSRLAEALRNFHERNNSLKEVLALATATQLQQMTQTEHSLDSLIKDEDANRLGLSAHAQIHQLLTKPDSQQDDRALAAEIQDFSADQDITCCATLVTRKSMLNSRKQKVLLEIKKYPPGSEVFGMYEDSVRQNKIKSKVNQLANLLRTSGSSSVGTLECLGYINQPKLNQFAFIYQFPPNAAPCEPLTLYSIIKEHEERSKPIWNLNTRFKIALKVASSICGFHADGWVHKNLRSHALLFFKSSDIESDLMIDSPYLAGFEYSRPEDGSTARDRDDDRDRNLYRHPALQTVAGETFSKVHDLYSLGVVLLEIAMWRTASSICVALQSGSSTESLGSGRIDPMRLHKQYIRQAKTKIPYLMGEAYTSAVLACLESKYANHVYRADFSKLFYDQVVQNLSPQSLR